MPNNERNSSRMQELMDAQRNEKKRDAEFPEKIRIMRGFFLESGVAIADAFPNYGVAPDGSSWGDLPIYILSGFVKTINANKRKPRAVKHGPPELLSDRLAVIDAQKHEAQMSKTERFVRSTFGYNNEAHTSAPHTPFYRDPKSKLWCVRLLSRREIHCDDDVIGGGILYTDDTTTFIDVFEDGTLRDPSFLRRDQLTPLEKYEYSGSGGYSPSDPHKRYGGVGDRINPAELKKCIPPVLDELGIDRWVNWKSSTESSGRY